MSSGKIKILELRTVSGTGGGPEKTIFLTAKKLDPKRFETHILYTRNRFDPQFNWMKQQYALPESVSYSEYAEKHSYDLGLLKYIFQYCQHHEINIVHSHEYKTDVLCGLLRKKLSSKWVSTFHAAAFANLKLKLYQTWAYRELRKADRVFVVSPNQKALLEKNKIPEKSIYYLPNGVDTETYSRRAAGTSFRNEWGCRSETVAIGFMGRLSAEKNILLLIRAFAAAARRNPHIILVLAGEGPERKKIQKKVKELRLENKVHWMGFVENTVPFYASLDLYVQSSTTEGMPNTLLEAMAMELPVVTTAVGGNAELIEDGKEGYLVPSGDEDALTGSMLKLIEDAKRRRDMGKNGRQKAVSQFSFDRRVRLLEDQYEQLCQR